VPDKEMLSVGFGAVLVTVRLAVAVPADDGVNVTLKDWPCPGPRLSGRDKPLTLKPAPVRAACETVTVAVVEFVSVPVVDCEVPTCVAPKFTFVGLAAS